MKNKNFTIYYKLSVFCFFINCFVFQFSFASDLSMEGNSDWTMYQYNAQHTGVNDKDQIKLPIELKWVFSQAHLPDNQKLLPFNQPIIIGNRIIATTKNFQTLNPELSIRCFDLISGEILWSHFFYNVYAIDPPAYANGIIYCQVNNASLSKMYAFDLLTGEEVWNFPFYVQWEEELGPVPYKNKLLFSAGFYGGVHCINANSGDSIWIQDLIQSWGHAPAIHNDIYYMFVDGFLNAYSVDKSTHLWYLNPSTSNSQGPYRQDVVPVIDTLNHLLFLSWSKGIYAVNYITKETLWKKEWDPIYGYGDPRSSVAIYDNKVYAMIYQDFYCFDGLTGDTIWNFSVDTILRYSPIIASDYLFCSSDDSSYIYNIDSHKREWSFPASGNYAVGNNHFVLGSKSGDLYVFGSISTDVSDITSIELPSNYKLHQNYPNPFNPKTNIKFSLPKRSHVTIEIFNITGQKVRTVSNQTYEAGEHNVIWESRDDYGYKVSSGVYLYRLVTNEIVLNKKMLLLK